MNSFVSCDSLTHHGFHDWRQALHRSLCDRLSFVLLSYICCVSAWPQAGHTQASLGRTECVPLTASRAVMLTLSLVWLLNSNNKMWSKFTIIISLKDTTCNKRSCGIFLLIRLVWCNERCLTVTNSQRVKSSLKYRVRTVCSSEPKCLSATQFA